MSDKPWEMLHLGLVVKDLNGTVSFLERLGGKTISPEKGPPPGTTVQLRFQHVQLGNVDFELFEQQEGESPLSNFINTHGEGVHHLAFSIGDMQEELCKIRKHCTNIYEQIPQKDGRKDATIESHDLGGLQIQLVQLPPESK